MPINDEIFNSFLFKPVLNAVPPCEIFDKLDPAFGTLLITPFTLPLIINNLLSQNFTLF